MSDQEHYHKLERMYLKANINTGIFDTTTAKIGEGIAEIGLDITDKYFHALGAIHGSVYFKLLDDAAFFAVNSLVKDVFVLTTSFNINLIRPANQGTLKAVGKIKFRSKNLFVAESVLYNEQGKEIAFGTGNFAKSKIELSEKIGYR
ncbi:PaaI family thioesterase [Aquimarina sp. D1M17]|uniref:PaaI family thioesterase n=1 Tax=Aquimarina acroporae TaxID=2937283 RepID=UPI0020BF0FEE|nr:PaaI family thioesterase [Aquimarina acroporae]MCK8523657.1 PaaI family thioesterase [Aquimarina acroporae]